MDLVKGRLRGWLKYKGLYTELAADSILVVAVKPNCVKYKI